MKTVSADEMRELDRTAIEDYGIPGLILMENAGRGVAELIAKTFQERKVLIICGTGNNGGDGFVIARHLHNKGYETHTILVGSKEKLKPDALTNFKIVEKMNLPVTYISDHQGITQLQEEIKKADVCVDALFGVGLARNIEGIEREVIELLNSSKKTVVAVDVPSGIHSDTGEVMGIAVGATVTATLGVAKMGLLAEPAKGHTGSISLVEIGLPRAVISPS